MLADCPTTLSSQMTLSGIDPTDFMSALWNSPDYGMYVMTVIDRGRDFSFLAFNAATAAMSPVPVEQLLGKRLGDAFSDEMAGVYRQHYADCVSSGAMITFDEKLSTVNGDTWWHLSVYPIKNSVGTCSQLLVTSTDITAKRKAEMDLESSRRILQQVVDTLPSAIFWKDLKSCYLGCNQSFATIAGGKTTAEVIGKSDFDLPWKKEESEWFVACDQRIMAADEPEQNIIEPQFQADGKQAWLSTSKIPLHDGDGNVSGILGIIEDVTEHRATQDEQAKLLAIVEATPDIVAIADAQGNQQYLNRAGQLIFGIESENICDFTIQDVVSPGIFQMLMDEAMPTAAQKGSWRGESLIRDCHGRDVPVSQVIICHKCEDGNVESFSTVMRDISDRKAAEAILRETAERQEILNQITIKVRDSLDLDTVISTALSTLQESLQLDYTGFAWLDPQSLNWQIVQVLDNTDNPYVLGDRDTDRLGLDIQSLRLRRISQVNDVNLCQHSTHRAFLTELGIGSEVVIPVMTETDQMGVLICQYVQAYDWSVNEVELLKSVGDQLAIAINQADLYSQSFCQSKALAHSLEQLKRTQAQIIQAEKMSSLGQMVAGVAHEINNPVNFIHGNLRPAQEYTQDLLGLIALYRSAYPSPTPEIEAELEAIELEFVQEDLPKLLSSMSLGTDRIREIVLSLRNFSRVDESAVKTVDLHDGINSTLVILGHRLKSTDVSNESISIIKQYGKLPDIDCYPSQLNQVLMNILANAIDAMAETVQPTITITTAIQGDLAIIRLADNGPGIPLEAQPHILDPFFTTKPVGKGTGMGMSISYQIITEKHGGNLTFTSEVGKGTEFVIEIPLRQPEAT